MVILRPILTQLDLGKNFLFYKITVQKYCARLPNKVKNSFWKKAVTERAGNQIETDQ